MLVGVLLALEEEPHLIDRLEGTERQLLKYQTERFLGSLSVQEYESAMRSIKSLGDKLSDLWHKYGGPLAVGIQALLAKAGLDSVAVPSELVSEMREDGTLPFHFESLIRVAQKLGFESTYVLVDRVDETQYTNNDADATFLLIRPLLTELPVLETRGAGFRFFLWDRIEADYRSSGARPDRIPILSLHWTIAELQDMLTSRLSAFSDGRVRSLNDLHCVESSLDVHRLVCILAGGSPRDMIRLVKSIVNEQTRTGTGAECVDEASIYAGVRSFADERALELAPNALADLRRIGQCTFTINHLASEIFHINSQSARAKVQQWMGAGAVEQVGEIPNPRGRPTHLYGISDMRVAIAALPGLDVELLLGTLALECPNCAVIQMSDAEDLRCTSCGRGFTLRDARSLREVCGG